MKIKMLVSIAGADFSLTAGEETDRFPQAEAIRFIEAGYAAPVAEQKVERAIKKPAKEKRNA